MEYNVAVSLPLLRQTPRTLKSLMNDLPGEWIQCSEGDGTWSPHEVVGHLVHGEMTDWIPRVERLLEHGEDLPFEPFNRTGFVDLCGTRSTSELLEMFSELRARSLEQLGRLQLTPRDLAKRGRHPDFGAVELSQLLSAWVVHDLGHIRQIVRTMAHQYDAAVGPWKAYLTILGDRS